MRVLTFQPQLPSWALRRRSGRAWRRARSGAASGTGGWAGTHVCKCSPTGIVAAQAAPFDRLGAQGETGVGLGRAAEPRNCRARRKAHTRTPGFCPSI